MKEIVASEEAVKQLAIGAEVQKVIVDAFKELLKTVPKPDKKNKS